MAYRLANGQPLDLFDDSGGMEGVTRKYVNTAPIVKANRMEGTLDLLDHIFLDVSICCTKQDDENV